MDLNRSGKGLNCRNITIPGISTVRRSPQGKVLRKNKLTV
jgi:hypothetical protein